MADRQVRRPSPGPVIPPEAQMAVDELHRAADDLHAILDAREARARTPKPPAGPPAATAPTIPEDHNVRDR